MKLSKLITLSILLLFCCNVLVKAQLVGDQIFLQGRFLEVGVAPNAAWGNTMPVPAGYNTHTGSSLTYPDPLTGVVATGNGLDFSYDPGHDGWTVGSPTPTTGPNCCFYGAFFMPGTPFDGWSVQMNGVRSDAFYTSSGFALGGGAAFSGTNVDYKYRQGSSCGPYMESTAAGYWAGTYSVGGGTISIRSTNRIDTNASWDKVNVTFKNTGATPVTGIYYLVTGDPDNDQVIPVGSFPTNNRIIYQGDAANRHEVIGRAPAADRQDAFSGLATKDCRAKAMIYTNWPPPLVPGNALDLFYSESTTGLTSTWYNVGDNTTTDIAMALIFNVGDLAPGDSTRISYAWIFSDTGAIDSAFMQPQLNLNCAIVPDNGDTLNICGMDTVPVNIVNGEWGCTNWVWSPAVGLATTTGIENNIIVDLVPGTTTYTVTSSDASSCNTFQFTFTVEKVPPTITATYNPPVCSGNTLILTSSPDLPGAAWLWKGPDGYTSTASDPIRTPAFTSYSGVYTVIATRDGCIDSTTVAVVVDSTPEVPIVSSNSYVCEFDTLELFGSSATAGVTYSWAGPSGYTSTMQNPVRYSVPFIANGNYTVTATLGACSSQNVVFGEVRQKPDVVAGSNSPVCTGNPLNLTTTAPPGSTFSWTGPLTFTSGLQYPTINPAITANSGTYSVVVTLNGCADTAWVTAVVDTTPELPVLTTNSPGAPGPTICEGDTLTFTAYSATMFTVYSWTGPGSFSSTEQNPVIYNATPAASGVYTLIASIGTCSTTPTLVTATVTPTPPLSATSNTPVCSGSGDTLLLQAIGSPGSTFTWTGPYTFFSNAQNPQRNPVSTEYGGVYHVSVLLDGCTNAVNHTVVVNPTPTPPWIKWLTYCQYYDAPYLQAFGSNVLWHASGVSGGSATSVPPKPQTDTVGIRFYYVNQTLLNCPSAIDSIRVTVRPTPKVTVSPDRTVCPWDSVMLTAVNEDAIAYYKWFPEMYLDKSSVAVVTSRPETDIEYMVVTSNMYDCTDTAKVKITVKPNAVVHVRDSVTLFPGETFQIEPTTNCTWFSWAPAGGLSSKHIANPVASPEISTKYVVTGMTEWGCKTQDSINVNVNTDAILTLPNAFAPGSANSLFKIIKKGAATLRHFRVYDRWGVLVFQTSNIDEGWDGTFKGVPQPVGVYVYDVMAVSNAGKEFAKSGNVTLLR